MLDCQRVSGVLWSVGVVLCMPYLFLLGRHTVPHRVFAVARYDAPAVLVHQPAPGFVQDADVQDKQ